MKIITIDFETYYDREFSLSKITTEEYIRHEMFETIGVGIKVNDGRSQWFSGTHQQTQDYLSSIDWSDAVAVAHNAMFDAAILSWRFNIHPYMWCDTLSLARAIDGLEVSSSLKSCAERHNLGAKGTEVVNALALRRQDFDPEQLARYGEYCKNDCDLTWDLLNVYLPCVSDTELKVIDLTIKMFSEPVLRLAKKRLSQHLEEVKARKYELLQACKADSEILNSNPKFADLLISLGVEPPTKISLATGKETYAFAKTDEGLKDLAEHPNPVVQAVVAARLGTKSTLEESRTERFLGIASRGSLPVPLKYYAAHTGRWGGSDNLNLQNLPSRGDSTLKECILPPKGYVIIDCDSSQIEARVLAWVAGQGDLVQAFANKEDVYKIMASKIYRKPVDEISKDERFMGKTVVLGCLAEGTLVLCKRGWVPIEQVSVSDKVWDGEEWVCHQGLLNSGCKETLNLCGVWLTPDHRVWSGTQWKRADFLTHDAGTLSQALDSGAANLPSWVTSKGAEAGLPRSLFGAIVGGMSTQSITITSKISKAHDAIFALKNRLLKLESYIGDMPTFSQMMSIANGYSTDFLQLSAVAITSGIKRTKDMEIAEYLYVKNGGIAGGSFYDTRKLLMDGIFQITKWIEWITTKGTNRETSALYLEEKTSETEEVSIPSRKKLQTFDLAYCGPRNRYTILSDKGPLIVHNCGYGLGAEKFQSSLKTAGVDLELPECKQIIKTYRESYEYIPELWKDGQRCLEAMLQKKTSLFGTQPDAVMLKKKGFYLPSGYYLGYTDLEKDAEGQFSYKTRKGRTKIYGGKVVENVIQAIARCVIAEQMTWIAKKYRVVLTVHDAIAIVAPLAEAERAQQYVEKCMSTPPEWAAGLPLACESGIGENYGQC